MNTSVFDTLACSKLVTKDHLDLRIAEVKADITLLKRRKAQGQTTSDGENPLQDTEI